jgi:hypothetical protein
MFILFYVKHIERDMFPSTITNDKRLLVLEDRWLSLSTGENLIVFVMVRITRNTLCGKMTARSIRQPTLIVSSASTAPLATQLLEQR